MFYCHVVSLDNYDHKFFHLREEVIQADSQSDESGR